MPRIAAVRVAVLLALAAASPQQLFKTPPFWDDAVLLLEGVE